MQNVATATQGLRALNPEQVDAFWADGYLKVGKILTDDEIECYRAEYDRIFAEARAGKVNFRNLAIDNTDDLDAKNKAGKQLLQIMQMCEQSILFRRLVGDDRILDVIEDLLGPNIQLFHDQGLWKPAYTGGPVHWHQDNAYWRCSPPNLVSAWLTLDDVTRENGAMQFIPGTHLQTVGHGKASTSNALLDSGDQADTSRAVVVDLPAGGITIHHCQTLHMTEPNTTPNQRRAIAIHYMVPGTRSLRTGDYLGVSFGRPLLRARI
ncbi:MAG: phytanoyl-CoA dioxygenase family protein [Caldilineaceae bacterium]|nr:phytanoyl-CoA dioxygenase family protein [Caldilineaceae bacterium]